jgi:hypothetical protein
MFRVGQNIFDGRHFTSFASFKQWTELHCSPEGIRSSCEAPHPPTSLSPCGSKNRWQVLRELRELLCQRFLPSPRAKREITNLCPELIHLCTNFDHMYRDTNHLVASFPQESPSSRPFFSRVCAAPRVEMISGRELRDCSLLEPSSVRVAPSPMCRRGTRSGHHDLRRSAMVSLVVDDHAGPRHHR